MKRMIVAIAALGMLATASSVRAERYGNSNLWGTYVETFQTAAGAPAPITGICQFVFDGGGNIVIGTPANPISYCFTDNGASSIGCYQAFVSPSTYTVTNEGTGSITGTLKAEPCSANTTFTENLLIQNLDSSLVAQNVLVARTDAVVAGGDLVPQSGGPFSNATLYGQYTESLAGSIGGVVFAGVCNDIFDGNGSIVSPSSCTFNTPTGVCHYALSGGYDIFSPAISYYGPGTGLTFGTLTGSCGTVTFGEFLKVVDGAGEVAAVSHEGTVIEAGTYLPQE